MRYPLPWFPLSDAPCCVVTKPDYLRYWSSLSGCRFGSSGSSGFVVGFHRLRLSNCGPVRRVRSYRIVSVGNGFGQPSGVVAIACGVTGGIGDIDGDLVEVV